MNLRLPLALGLLVLAFAAMARADLVAHNEAAAGRRLFQSGRAEDVIATISGTGAPLPPRLRRCAGCHGAEGRGAREGGVEIPPIAWSALAAPRDAAPGRPGRPAYDETALQRSLVDAVDPAGRTLAAGMPRFRLPLAQFTALSEYLRIVGGERDFDPGISSDEIRVGALLPLSGAQAAWGAALRAGLEQALTAAGPIYGRRLRLIAADAGTDAAAAMRDVLAGEGVFALVATLLPERGDEDGDAAEIPVVAPLAPSMVLPGTKQFHVLAAVEDQMRVLVDALAAEAKHPVRMALVGREGHVADAVADQATRNGAVVFRLANGDELTPLQPPPDVVVALPDVDLLELAGRRGDWLLAGTAEAVALDRAIDPRFRLVLPILPAAPRTADPAAVPVPPLALAAAIILVEAVKRSGSRPSRTALIAAIESLQGFPTGVLPPLSFGRAKHTGSRAAVVIRPDRDHGFVALGGWRTPH